VSYCINPNCQSRVSAEGLEICQTCGTDLIINGRYRLIRSMRESRPLQTTEVFLASDASGSPKVIKILSPQNQDQVERLEREAFVLSTFAGPGIPDFNIDDYFIWQPSHSRNAYHCLVMQFIDGQNLEQWVNERGKASQDLILDWLSQLTKILQRFHLGRIYQGPNGSGLVDFGEYSFIHSDIKPENLMLQPDGQLIVIDYGLITPVGQTTGTKTVGTGGYIAPEQANGQPVIQSDFYAMGKSMIHLATGVPLNTLKIDPKTGQFSWHHLAAQIDKPLADFLDSLVSLTLSLRPPSDQVILDHLQKLPGEIKRFRRYRILKSPLASMLFLASLMLVSFVAYPHIASELYYRLGKESQLEGRFDDSRMNLENSLKMNPNRADVRAALALSCHLLGDIKCAMSEYQSSITLDPHSWKTHYNLGALYDDREVYKQAQVEYQTALGLPDGKNYLVLNNLARLYNLTHRYPDAAKLAWQGLKVETNPIRNANLYKNLGWALYGMKKYKDSKTYLLKSTKLSPNQADSFCLLAQSQEADGDRKNAQTSWDNCLFSNSSNPEVKVWRKLYQRRKILNE
jgi:serine/threonine protein kinase